MPYGLVINQALSNSISSSITEPPEITPTLGALLRVRSQVVTAVNAFFTGIPQSLSPFGVSLGPPANP